MIKKLVNTPYIHIATKKPPNAGSPKTGMDNNYTSCSEYSTLANVTDSCRVKNDVFNLVNYFIFENYRQ